MGKTRGLVASDIRIDKSQLDVEWEKQPIRMMEAAEMLAKAEKELTEAKIACELVEAQVSLKVRRKPEKYLNGAKLTEAVVDAIIASHEEVIAARTKKTEAAYQVDLLKAVVSALHQKKAALQDLVTLHSMSYFSAPKTSAKMTGKAREKFENGQKRRIRNPQE